MPDGKRNSIPSEGEIEGENCFYEDLQNASSPIKKLPLSLNSRGFQNLSERLLKTMVANEVQKTLNGEDNKKLVAHHRPVLHSENDINESEMLVVGVVLNAKQSQNDEVSKAIEMLRRNGVTCMCFTIKDTPNGIKKVDENQSSSGDYLLPEELSKAFKDQPCVDDENDTEHKVSSPTISTTSDAPPSDLRKDDESETNQSTDGNPCTSTTPITVTDNENSVTLNKEDILVTESLKHLDLEPYVQPTFSPSPPILFPQVSISELKDVCGEDILPAKVKRAPPVTSSQRPKKRRKRANPYVYRRKSRKRKNPNLPVLLDVRLSRDEESVQDHSLLLSPAFSDKVSKLQEKTPIQRNVLKVNSIPVKNADPYEFEDSDQDHVATINGTVIKDNKDELESEKKAISKRSKKSKGSHKRPNQANKRSPRKRLTFNSSRAFSPDITDHDSSSFRDMPVQESDLKVEGQCSSHHSCVQPISRYKVKDRKLLKNSKKSNTSKVSKRDAKLVLSYGQSPVRCDESTPPNHGYNEEVKLRETEKDDENLKSTVPVAQTPCVQNNNVQPETLVLPEAEQQKLISAQTGNDDSLQDTPDFMQLRRSSFYSSISRNVRTNLEKYLDGRPQDLKSPKKPRKLKTGFLLHHGDNFPEDPEAPYRLHLATQVLLKLNKRRVKCKPKEDKGKSLLSYLKLQPKRVSRVGKHSKVLDDAESSAKTEDTTVFSGEWTVPRKYICNICGQVENAFWDMVMHKGEIHPGIVVTHVELPENPPEGFRCPPSPRNISSSPNPQPCSKCAETFTTYSDLHRHIFECAGNASVLEVDSTPKVVRKKKSKRKSGFKRRISGTPKKSAGNAATLVSVPSAKLGEIITKRRFSEVFKCEFCTREFKTEGWLKNHISLSHSLPISIPLEKLSLPSRASITSSRRFTSQLTKPNKQICREA